MNSPNLPYEVIYEIFKQVDDFDTARHFSLLNKLFYVNYCRTNEFKMHKTHLVFKTALVFFYDLLEMSPDEIKQRIYSNSKRENDFITSVYQMIFWAIFKKSNMKTQSIHSLINAVITSNPDFVLNIMKININTHREIEITIPSLFKVFMYKPRYPYRYINNQIALMEKYILEKKRNRYNFHQIPFNI